MTTATADLLLCIPPDKVGDIWHVVRPMIERAYAETDEEMPDDMAYGLAHGKFLLWISTSSDKILMALVTALIPRPSGLACKLMVCSGSDMGLWIGKLPQIEAYARAEGCSKVFCEGRPGWARVLAQYQTKRVVLEKRL